VLRMDLETGEPLPDNPFIGSDNERERLVYTYGHRNIQGVALRPDSDQVFTAEHGPDKNDEVNLVEAGRNYGWDPAQGGTVGGYDEDVPMTDLERFPDAVPAKWQTGEITEAVCAATFLEGEQWGTLNGTLVVTALKGAKVIFLSLSEAGDVTTVATPPEFNSTFGRLRAARTGPDGALYLTTSNGSDDKLLRVTPV
jgi:aldose sugar dehydrogenase